MPGNRSVLHLVGLVEEPPTMFPASEVVPVRLSEEGFRRMLAAIERTFALTDSLPQSMGPGLYGPSLFYRANGAFSFLNLCNHWTAGMLAEAGLSAWPVLATVAPGLMWTLRAQLQQPQKVSLITRQTTRSHLREDSGIDSPDTHERV
jgi:hypothetical protein